MCLIEGGGARRGPKPDIGAWSRTTSRVRTTSGCPVVFLIVYPICPRKQGQSAGKTGPLTRTIPRPRGRAFQLCIIGFLYAYAAYVKAADGAHAGYGNGLRHIYIYIYIYYTIATFIDFHFLLLFLLSLLLEFVVSLISTRQIALISFDFF